MAHLLSKFTNYLGDIPYIRHCSCANDWIDDIDVKLNANFRDGSDEYVWDHYEESVPMSTYLVAFVVSKLEYRVRFYPINVQFLALDIVLLNRGKIFVCVCEREGNKSCFRCV